MSNRLTGRNAVVTGAASGLGEATVRRFHAEGARVILADLAIERAQAIAASLDPSGKTAKAVACDIADPASCDHLVIEAEAFFGAPIDLFHANAGTSISGALPEADPAQIARAIGINLTGAIFSAQAALRSLARAGQAAETGASQACLLFTSSLQGVIARAERSVYTASKHAITGLTKSLALEFGPQGVRVNALAPVGIDTPLLRTQLSRVTDDVDGRIAQMGANLPLGHLPTPDDFTDAAVFLASREARCITGHTLLIDCGAAAGLRDPARR